MTKRSKAPEHLGELERDLWVTITRDYALDDAPGLALLAQALEAHQLARECRETIDKEGLMIAGKPHPLLITLRDARKCFGVFLKQCNFDLEPLHGRPGRPSGS